MVFVNFIYFVVFVFQFSIFGCMYLLRLYINRTDLWIRIPQ